MWVKIIRKTHHFSAERPLWMSGKGGRGCLTCKFRCSGGRDTNINKALPVEKCPIRENGGKHPPPHCKKSNGRKQSLEFRESRVTNWECKKSPKCINPNTFLVQINTQLTYTVQKRRPKFWPWIGASSVVFKKLPKRKPPNRWKLDHSVRHYVSISNSKFQNVKFSTVNSSNFIGSKWILFELPYFQTVTLPNILQIFEKFENIGLLFFSAKQPLSTFCSPWTER
jgi:hypothetical protein